MESTARDAMFCDRYVVIADDCVASDDREQHAASMLLMRHRFDLASAEEIEQAWAAAACAGPRSRPREHGRSQAWAS